MAEPTSHLPFRTLIALPDTLGDAQIAIKLRNTDSDVNWQLTNKIFLDFVSCADAGMFAGNLVPPIQSFMQVDSRISERGDELIYDCKTRGIDCGAFRILLGILAQTSHRFLQLTEVQITSAAHFEVNLGLDSILASPFPSRSEHLPFELRLGEYFFEHREPLFRMDFLRELDNDEFDELRVLIEAWNNIVNIGGYLDRFENAIEEPLINTETFMSSPTTLEHLIYGFEGPVNAFNAVINMMVKLDAKSCRLNVLEIE
jgi:hypothetical protein